MDNLPEDERPYQPTEQDWAEYVAWCRDLDQRTECCERHNWQDETVPCPDCEDEAWAETWALGEEPCEDWWYMDLLMQATGGHYNPHQGWRAEQ
jgi:hypothetical protein